MEGEDGVKLVPELYAVPADKVEEEFQNPGSQERTIVGRCPYMWAQSLYILGKLLLDVSRIMFVPSFFFFFGQRANFICFRDSWRSAN